MDSRIAEMRKDLALIESEISLLTAEPESSKECPDCHGKGWYYEPREVGSTTVGERVNCHCIEEEEKAAEPEPCPVHAEPELPTHPGGYSGAEPEPCEDELNIGPVRNIINRYLEYWRGHASEREYEAEMALEALGRIEETLQNASQVANRRAEELRAALLPFARFAETLLTPGRGGIPKSGNWYGLDIGSGSERVIKIEDFKRAQEALAATERKP